MDHLRALRLASGFLVGLAIAWALLWAPFAHAYPASGGVSEGPPGTRYEWALTLSGPWSGSYISKPAACLANPAPNPPYNFTTFYSNGTYGTECLYNVATGGQGGYGRVQTKGGSNCSVGYVNVSGTCQTPYTCPSGGTLTGTTCTCPVGQVDTGTGCVTPPTCDPPKYLNAAGTACECPTGYSKLVEMNIYGFKSTTAWSGSLACTGGCLLSTGKSTCSGSNCWTEYTGGMGSTCGASTLPPGSTEVDNDSQESKCLKGGGTPGTVGTTFVCLDKNTSGVPSKTTGTPSTRTEIKDNGDGTSTKTETTQTPTTTCDGAGSCQTTYNTTVTTTVINNGTGAPVGTPTTTEVESKPGDTEGSCDPTKEDCEPKSRFGGTCGGFTCDGDAIQCAIAREQHTRNCQTLTEVGGRTAAQAATWYAENSNGEGLESSDFNQTGTLPTLDTTTRSVGSAALTDLNITVMGQTIAVPFSALNEYLGYIGNLVILVAMLIAARIFHQGAVG